MTLRIARGTMLWLTLALVLASVPVAIAQEDVAPTVLTRDDATLGSLLIDPSGWTLYTFTADGPESSACTGQCSALWPPLVADGEVIAPTDAPGILSVFARDDGSMQVAYNLAPLYYYAADQQPGDRNGQGVGGSWFAATSGLTPASQDSPAPQPTAAPASPTSLPEAPAPTARPTPPSGPTAGPAPTSAPAPTPRPAPTPVPYVPPPIYSY